jgi:hypothetical protein
VKQVRQLPARFGAAAQVRSMRAGKVCRVATVGLTVQRPAASPQPLCGQRQKASVKVSVAGFCSLRQRLVETRSTTLRVVQAIGRWRTGRVRLVRVAVARFGKQNQGMSLSPVYRLACAAPAVSVGNRATCALRKAAPNWALEPTRSGRPRLAATGCRWQVSLRGQPRPASTVGSAQR